MRMACIPKHHAQEQFLTYSIPYTKFNINQDKTITSERKDPIPPQHAAVERKILSIALFPFLWDGIVTLLRHHDLMHRECALH